MPDPVFLPSTRARSNGIRKLQAEVVEAVRLGDAIEAEWTRIKGTRTKRGR